MWKNLHVVMDSACPLTNGFDDDNDSDEDGGDGDGASWTKWGNTFF